MYINIEIKLFIFRNIDNVFKIELDLFIIMFINININQEVIYFKATFAVTFLRKDKLPR